MTGGIGDEKLSGRSGISFDIINESENFPILEIFFVDRFGLYRMRIGQMMTVFEIMIQGGIVVDLFIGEMEFGVVLRIRKIHPRGTVLPVCFGIRSHAHKHGSDGRAEPEGSGNTGPWMKVTAHGYAHMLCSTHEQQKGR